MSVVRKEALTLLKLLFVNVTNMHLHNVVECQSVCCLSFLCLIIISLKCVCHPQRQKNGNESRQTDTQPFPLLSQPIMTHYPYGDDSLVGPWEEKPDREVRDRKWVIISQPKDIWKCEKTTKTRYVSWKWRSVSRTKFKLYVQESSSREDDTMWVTLTLTRSISFCVSWHLHRLFKKLQDGFVGHTSSQVRPCRHLLPTIWK